MVIGLGLFKWDMEMGIVLDIKYPESFELTENFVNKILITHAIDQDEVTPRSEDFVEIEMKDKTVFSYWRNLTEARGYELVIMILQKGEKVRHPNFKSQFIDFAKETLNFPQGENRREYFFGKVKKFFLEPKIGKLLLLGHAGTGKTSIKQVIFEGKEPNDLLANPLRPTTSLSPSVYSWLELELGLFDTVGQKFNEYLVSGKRQIQAFARANFIVYVFDYMMWIERNEVIFDDIKIILKIVDKGEDNSELILFLHKTDLIEEEKREEEIKIIEEEIKERHNLRIFFTSIYPNLIYDLYTAFHEILSNISRESSILREILDEKIKEHSKTLFFITNEMDNIVVQTMTPDFHFNLINYSHNLIARINQLFEEMKANDKIEHLMLSTFDEFNIIMKNLELSDYGLKNLVCISGTLAANKLIWAMGDVSRLVTKKIKSI